MLVGICGSSILFPPCPIQGYCSRSVPFIPPCLSPLFLYCPLSSSSLLFVLVGICGSNILFPPCSIQGCCSCSVPVIPPCLSPLFLYCPLSSSSLLFVLVGICGSNILFPPCSIQGCCSCSVPVIPPCLSPLFLYCPLSSSSLSSSSLLFVLVGICGSNILFPPCPIPGYCSRGVPVIPPCFSPLFLYCPLPGLSRSPDLLFVHLLVFALTPPCSD